MQSALSETEGPRLFAVRDPATGFALQKCSHLPFCSFDCGDADLNEWFRQDVVASTARLMTQTYALFHEGDTETLALVSVCNDAVRLEDLRDNISIPEGKRHDWPAVKIARLGVLRELQRNNLGSHAINLLKRMFITENRTGCRIMTVDAYNKRDVIKFYSRNGFELLVDRDQGNPTRAMWFDLFKVVEEMAIPQLA
ncbi:GNAT family N-acetyltransferase [Verrucomicrobium spinosum]|nr:GNAT family N-acetyltransferase [Verrucomicrobium spinosum]